GSNNSANFSINKASSTTTVTCADSTYDATPQADCTASFSGVGLTGGSLTVSYSGRGTTTYAGPGAPTNVGDYTGSASYGGDAKHNGSNNSANFSINKASSTTTVTCADSTYDATPQADCSASFSGVGLTGGSLAVSYSGRGTTTYAGPGAPTNVGDYTGS